MKNSKYNFEMKMLTKLVTCILSLDEENAFFLFKLNELLHKYNIFLNGKNITEHFIWKI